MLSFSDNFVPSSGDWEGNLYSNTSINPFQIHLSFLSNSTFTGLINIEHSTFDDVKENHTKISGHWNGHDISFQYGNYSGAGKLIKGNKIRGRYSDGILEYNFQLLKPSPIVIQL